MVPEGLTITSGIAVGAVVGAGTDVAEPPLEDGTDVGAMAVGEGAPGTAVAAAGAGVAVADDPHANMAASRRARGPRIIIFGFFNQWFKTE